jgi:hypothetical protein
MELAYIIAPLSAGDAATGYFDLHNCYEVVRVTYEGTKGIQAGARSRKGHQES